MHKLTEIDEMIGIVTIKKLQRKAIILITCTLGFITVLSICDYFTWLHSNKKKNLTPRVDRGPLNYTPIYFMYFVITVFDIQYALASFHIGERFARMNQIIERFLKSYKISDYFKRDLGLVGEFKHQRQMASIMASDTRSLPGRETKVFDWLVAGNDNKSIADGVSLLITLHGNLCQSTLLLNTGFGIPLLFNILSCLLHLIITPYFVYIEVHDEHCSYRVITMQILWIVFHMMGLLVTVQPCYWSCVQAKETGVIISELLTLKWDIEIRKQLEIFSLQMLHRPLEFSACGLFIMDRTLVTSIAGAVTTYLVILIQFQSGDDDDNQNVALKNATDILKTLTADVLKNS
ncbi:gustatory receptor for sugar taste 43a-like [Belonocnema kinseyi]|uniref:gustatory receptor for sugar taste 43a-like n=1 Tax=Belonocnema kinseyi TaxID=2817044 RepID=UPI00143D6064|nr:gustatory receptor for sugar taste 43a-like [Belonocnema kinseyi]